MQYVITAEHPPQLCPSSNAKIRQMVQQGMPQLPALAQAQGIGIITVNIFGPDHKMVFVVESPSIEAVREFVRQGRVYQWNTVTINATWGPEEALKSLEGLDPIF